MDLAVALLQCASDRPKPSDAIVLLEGDGFCRCAHAAALYREGLAPQILFSGGIIDRDYGSYPFPEVSERLVGEGVPESALKCESSSQNTREQAVEVVGLSLRLGWKKLILVASPEHQLRAFLTFLREIIDRGSDLILYNSPAVGLPWNQEQPWGTRVTRVGEEMRRIERYSQLGHLATYREAIDYQRWKEQQP